MTNHDVKFNMQASHSMQKQYAVDIISNPELSL